MTIGPAWGDAGQRLALVGIDPHQQAALAAGTDRHVAVDEKGQPAEHALLGQAGFPGDEGADALGECLVVGHEPIIPLAAAGRPAPGEGSVRRGVLRDEHPSVASEHRPKESPVPRTSALAATIALALGLAACGGSSSSSSTASSSASPAASTSRSASSSSSAVAPASATPAASGTVAIAASTNALKFNTTAVSAKAGTVHISFTNQASFGHNLTLIKGTSGAPGRSHPHLHRGHQVPDGQACARHLHVLLQRSGPSHGRHAGHAHRALSPWPAARVRGLDRP